MITFLEETLNTLYTKHKDLSSFTIIFPSKRAGSFFKHYLKNKTDIHQISPIIVSIEEFIEEISETTIIDPIPLIFNSYKAYLQTNSIKVKDNFDDFNSWISTLLSDFNEIDRHLIPPKDFFKYLHNIQDLNHWYLENKKTTLIKNYLQFWEGLFDFYTQLTNLLTQKNLGYQGLVYRNASMKIEDYVNRNPHKKHLFIGFNALNKAEQVIFQKLLETGKTDIYWDIDSCFLNDPSHSAGNFIREYKNNWQFYKKHSFQGISNNYKTHKKFNFVEIQNNVGQIKYVAQILAQLSLETINKTAIVLADETLLVPLLNSLPLNVKEVNITMGLPIKKLPPVLFFELLFELHIKASDTFYYHDILTFLNHPITKKIVKNTNKIIEQIKQQNKIYLSFQDILKLAPNDKEILSLLFKKIENNSTLFLQKCLKLIDQLQKIDKTNFIYQIGIYKLEHIFLKIKNENHTHNFIKTVTMMRHFFNQYISTTTIDYQGNAHRGLQIMGILETRVLDFENLIITSVNEGVLPSGKSNNSFITYDLKKQFDLPKYTEKDAIYTYHFYRLLQRSKEITLIYTTISEGVETSEKSRFISQIEIDQHPKHTLIYPKISPSLSIEKPSLIKITKDEAIMQQIQNIAFKGFSPSSLTTYIRNPLQFYYQHILKITEFDKVEETIAANTLGTIIHNTLEVFYQPLVGKFLKEPILKSFIPRIKPEVIKQFTKNFKGDYLNGKNLIIFEAANRYIFNFINFEINEIQSGNQIKIIKIESRQETKLTIPEIPFPIKIKGFIDRLDQYNGTLRVIDYKTGMVSQGDVELIAETHITKDYKYSKIIQLLLYCYMFQKNNHYETLEAGIISFKNLKNGFLKFCIKPTSRSKDKNTQIKEDTIAEYMEQLKDLISEICNPNIDFIEKEV
ncbi:MAG: PD-(D/E)XK nuclease family protein [Flavobacteriales bacterium]